MMKSKLIQILGKNITIDKNKTENITEDITYGKSKIQDKMINTYIIENNLLINSKKIECKVVGIIEMENEEERIIVAEKDSKISYTEIKGYFRNIKELENAKFKCLYEKSSGVIAYRMINDIPHFLITYSKKNFPGFPKGHVEYGETEEKTAIREILEEAGIKVELKNNFRESITYTVFEAPTQKEVVFFLGKILENEKVKIDFNELNKFQFVTFDEAKCILNEELMQVLSVANKCIKN